LLPKVDRPLLVLWGADDPWTPIAGSKIYQELVDDGRSVKFVSIPNTGHCPHDERPSEVNSLILDWMAELN